MATLNNFDNIISTILKRKYEVFSFGKEKFFAYKKQKICGYDVILNISCLEELMNFTLICVDCLVENHIKINKQIIKNDILQMKVPFWHIYESILSDLRNSLYEMMENEN